MLNLDNKIKHINCRLYTGLSVVELNLISYEIKFIIADIEKCNNISKNLNYGLNEFGINDFLKMMSQETNKIRVGLQTEMDKVNHAYFEMKDISTNYFLNDLNFNTISLDHLENKRYIIKKEIEPLPDLIENLNIQILDLNLQMQNIFDKSQLEFSNAKRNHKIETKKFRYIVDNITDLFDNFNDQVGFIAHSEQL